MTGRLAPPLELVVRGHPRVVAYACAKCGAVIPVSTAVGNEATALKGAERIATTHCERLCRCGALIEGSHYACATCQNQEAADRAALLYERAAKVPIDDYPDDPLFWDGHVGSMGTGFFEHIEELLDYCERAHLDVPLFVWACGPRDLQLSAAHIIDEAMDSFGSSPLEASSTEDLQKVLTEWGQRTKLRTWYPDYGRAVLLRMDAASALASLPPAYQAVQPTS